MVQFFNLISNRSLNKKIPQKTKILFGDQFLKKLLFLHCICVSEEEAVWNLRAEF